MQPNKTHLSIGQNYDMAAGIIRAFKPVDATSAEAQEKTLTFIENCHAQGVSYTNKRDYNGHLVLNTIALDRANLVPLQLRPYEGDDGRGLWDFPHAHIQEQNRSFIAALKIAMSSKLLSSYGDCRMQADHPSLISIHQSIPRFGDPHTHYVLTYPMKVKWRHLGTIDRNLKIEWVRLDQLEKMFSPDMRARYAPLIAAIRQNIPG